MSAENRKPQLARLEIIFTHSSHSSMRKITLAKWVKSLKNTISKTLRAERIALPHWQKAFFDHVLRSSESYSEKWEYVYENPARA